MEPLTPVNDPAGQLGQLCPVPVLELYVPGGHRVGPVLPLPLQYDPIEFVWLISAGPSLRRDRLVLTSRTSGASSGTRSR